MDAGALGRRRRRGGTGFDPLALYSVGEAGLWADPSDLTPEKISWRRNLLTWSEQFDNAAWSKNNASVTANAAIAPDGTTTADKLIDNATVAGHFVQQVVSVAVVTHAYSVYAKAAELSVIAVQMQQASDLSKFAVLYYDLTAGAVEAGESSTALSDGTIEPVGNGWYRCTVRYTPFAAGNHNLRVFAAKDISGNKVNYAGNGTDGVLIWGAQLESVSTASSYQRITDFTSDFLAAFPTHALYQDSAGTTPVTALGQPVGLVLDKRLGGLASAGPELITNGGFTGGGTGWTTTGTVSFTNNAAVLGDNSDIRQSFTTVAGRSYIVQYEVLVATNKGVLQIGTTSGGSQIYSSPAYVTTIGPKQIVFTATGATTWFRLLNDVSPSSNWTVDTVSIREVPGSHAIQPTSASRPTCDARVNLLTFSEQFDNAAWGKQEITITANAAVAPDGTTTADLAIPSTVASTHQVFRLSVLSAASCVATIYAKASGYSTLVLLDGTNGSDGATFDLNAGTATPAGAGTGTITPVGNGWFQCVARMTTTGYRLYIPSTSSVFAGNGTSGVLLWGADLRLASDAVYPYQRVVTASDYADVGAPRYLTFDGVDDSLYTAANVDFATWTSGTRRNLLLFPSAFDNSSWTKDNASVVANATTAPDGTTTADKIVEDTANAGHGVNQFFAASATTYTISVFAKAAERSWLRVAYTAVGVAYFNLSNGTVGTNSFASATITNVGNGWYRCTVTGTPAAGNTNVFFRATTGDNVSTYTGDGTSGIFLWGAQLELGTTATTFQDVGTDKVSVFTGVRKLSDAASAVLVELSADANSNNGAFAIYAPISTATTDISFRSRGTTTVTITSGQPAPLTRVIAAQADIAAPSATLRFDGVAVAPSSSSQGTGTFGTYVLFIGRRNNVNSPLNGRLYQLLVRGAASDVVTVSRTEQWVAQRTGVTL